MFEGLFLCFLQNLPRVLVWSAFQRLGNLKIWLILALFIHCGWFFWIGEPCCRAERIYIYILWLVAEKAGFSDYLPIRRTKEINRLPSRRILLLAFSSSPVNLHLPPPPPSWVLLWVLEGTLSYEKFVSRSRASTFFYLRTSIHSFSLSLKFICASRKSEQILNSHFFVENVNNLYYLEPQMCLFILIHKYPALQDRMQISRQIENIASVCLHCLQNWFSRSHGLINYIDTKAKCRL